VPNGAVISDVVYLTSRLLELPPIEGIGSLEACGRNQFLIERRLLKGRKSLLTG